MLSLTRNLKLLTPALRVQARFAGGGGLSEVGPGPKTKEERELKAIGAHNLDRYDDPTGRATATEPAHIKAIVDQISQLKFYEINLLNEALKRELKIPDVQRVVAAANVADAGADGAPEEGAAAGVKSAYTVKLTKFDEGKKVALIKEIKKLIEGINLVEAKRFVEDCPKVIRSNLSKDEAEALQKQLEAAGGIVKLE